ncbi:MAG: DUF692 family protein [Calothrix sp. SM1_5_4]|nr:DUF692 family protein [Calothrix sp. SM1_5_4]
MQLAALGLVSYFEFLIDNFVHIPPTKIAAEIGDVPCAFHIMKSEFLECAPEELKRYGKLIRTFVRTLKPLYVSDHLARFNVHQMNLPIVAEYSYAKTDIDRLSARVGQWQEALGTQIFLENFPSRTTAFAAAQPEFLVALSAKSGCGILFDVSNAIVASVNGNVKLSDWIEVAKASPHFHVAGFRKVNGKSGWLLDSHDSVVTEDTFEFLSACLKATSVPESMTYERDANLNIEEIAADLRRFQRGCA